MALDAGVLHDRNLPQVIHALQCIEENPKHLARQRDQLYSDSPPPYSSGETTQPPTPAPFALAEYECRLQQQEDRVQSTPYW